MSSEIKMYSSLLACGLGVAYWASLPETTAKKTSVQLFDIDRSQISEIVYESKGLRSKISAQKKRNRVGNSGSGDQRFWVELMKNVKSKIDHEVKTQSSSLQSSPLQSSPLQSSPLQSKSKKMAAESPKPKHSPSSVAADVVDKFLAGGKLENLLSAFSPFEAIRTIGEVESSRLGEFGLDKNVATFSIQEKGKGRAFQYLVGSKSYGTKSVFIMDKRTHIVYLVDRAPISLLQNSRRRLFERRIFDLDYAEIEEARVVADNMAVLLTHRDRNEKGDLQWILKGGNSLGTSKKAKPDLGSDHQVSEAKSVNAIYRNWLNKIKKLRVISYPTVNDLDEIKKSPDFLAVSFSEASSKAKHELRFRMTNDTSSNKGKLSSQSGKQLAKNIYSYWIHTSYLGGWAKLGGVRMESIKKDIPSILESE